MYEAAKIFERDADMPKRTNQSTIDQRARIVWASFAQGSPPSVGSNDCDAMTLMTQSVPHELPDAMCSLCLFHALVSTSVEMGAN